MSIVELFNYPIPWGEFFLTLGVIALICWLFWAITSTVFDE